MGQRLLNDKIGTLNTSGSNIILGPSRLTIGGQQYNTTSNLNVAMNLSSANTRYQIFAVVVGGAINLVVSQNENSAGPVGYNAWKLVGSYYSNGLDTIGFGSFVNITGAPQSDWWNAGKTIVYDSVRTENGAVSTDAAEDRWLVRREGKFLRYYWDYYTTVNTGAVAGSTTAYIFWPRNFGSEFDMDTAYNQFTVTFARSMTCHAWLGTANVAYDESTYGVYFRSYGITIAESDNSLDNGKFPLNVVTNQYSIKVRDTVPIGSWNETPIEDL